MQKKMKIPPIGSLSSVCCLFDFRSSNNSNSNSCDLSLRLLFDRNKKN